MVLRHVAASTRRMRRSRAQEKPRRNRNRRGKGVVAVRVCIRRQPPSMLVAPANSRKLPRHHRRVIPHRARVQARCDLRSRMSSRSANATAAAGEGSRGVREQRANLDRPWSTRCALVSLRLRPGLRCMTNAHIFSQRRNESGYHTTWHVSPRLASCRSKKATRCSTRASHGYRLWRRRCALSERRARLFSLPFPEQRRSGREAFTRGQRGVQRGVLT